MTGDPAVIRVGTTTGVRVPASSANLGPGFDSVGLALGLWDEAVATVVDRPGTAVEVSGEGAADIPLDESHLVVRAMHAMWRHLGISAPAGLHLQTRNGVPHGRGLGSSATAIVTGCALAQVLAVRSVRDGLAVEVDELDLSVINTVASGLEGHPDNASASVFGGATLSVMEPPTAASGRHPATTTIALPLHPSIQPVVLVPETVLSTTTARAVLPPSVPLEVAAANTARGGVLVHALTTDPAALWLGTADLLHQEVRRPNYAASMAVVDVLRGEGHAATISGAGPSVLVLTTEVDTAREAARRAAGEGWRILSPGVPQTGVGVIA